MVGTAVPRRGARVIALALVLIVGLGTLTACGGNSADDDTLVVYNAQHKELTLKWIDEFTKQTGIKVEIGTQADDMGLAHKLVAEGSKSAADVFLTENSPAMSLVESNGLFADVGETVKAQVPEQYRPKSGMWTGVAARATVFIYNKDKLTADQLPTSMSELAEPQWRGRWGSPRSSADFQAIVAAYLAVKGEDATRSWLRAMKDNNRLFANNVVTMQKVNVGEIDGGIIYHYYWFRDQAKTGRDSSNTALHYFRNQDPGAFISLSGAGILKSSKRPELARKFVEWLSSASGQAVLQTPVANEYPVASGVAPREGLEPLDALQAPLIDPSTLDSQKVATLMTEAGII